jgi:hypothetical protein
MLSHQLVFTAAVLPSGACVVTTFQAGAARVPTRLVDLIEDLKASAVKEISASCFGQ